MDDPKCWCDDCGWEGRESDVEVQKDEDGDNFRLCPVCNEELGVDFEGVLEKGG